VARSVTFIILIIALQAMVSCGAPAAQPTAPTQPATATPRPLAATAQPATSSTQAAPSIAPTATGAAVGQKLNLDDYMPKGTARDLVLRDCTTCHSFVPIITGQRPNARWLSLKQDHKDKASAVSQADYDTEFNYLIENFNDKKPEPKLPDWFIKQQPGVGE
jgi:hypothetical protein